MQDQQPSVAPYKGSFHFVVKNASNLNVRDAEEAFSISSHVTNKYYRWAKRNKSSTPPRSFTDSHGDSPSVGGGGSSSTSTSTSTSNSTSNSPEGSASMSREKSSTTSSTKSHAKRAPAMQTMCWQLGSGTIKARRQQCNTGSLSSSPEPTCKDDLTVPPEEEDDSDEYEDEFRYQLIQCHLDPAKPSAYIKPCGQLQRLAYHGLQDIFMSTAYTPSRNALKLQLATQRVQQHIKDFSGDDKCMHGWYAAVITMRAHFVDPRDYTRLWPMALMHQNRSLTLLREELLSGRGPSEAVLMCIWAICCVGFFSGEMAQNLQHGVAVRMFVDDLGGLSKLSHLARTYIISGDYINAKFTLTRPYYHHSLFDPGDFRSQPGFAQWTLPHVRDFDLHFQRWDEAFLIANDDLSDQLSHYVNMHREYLAAATLAEKMYEENQEESADEILEWLHKRHAALCSWSMSLYCDLTESIGPETRISRTVRRQLQACITLAVACSHCFIMGFNSTRAKWLLFIPVQHLQPQLEILLDHMSKRGLNPTFPSKPHGISHHESLLWLFFVGACAEQVSDEAGKRPVSDPVWHSTRFVDMTQLLGLRTWREAQKILKRFLYQESVMDRFVEGLFEQKTDLLRFGSPLRHP
ncbi:hypothetical protein B0A52_09511 [Exophiala mesophila]|uniref:Transcription factor domain-containing protein n=1 Tax=Exophiala mesophila TaxID=212818 RepID=A0A438MSM6_EXOME|nr:hypothetical protein B0A52_09511 [Exophiala mesophila]